MKKKMIQKVAQTMGGKAYDESNFIKIRPLMRAAAGLPNVYIEMQDFVTNITCTVKVNREEIFTFTYTDNVFDFIECEIYPYYKWYGWIE